jgi:uncharacterized protein (DUF2062 family)
VGLAIGVLPLWGTHWALVLAVCVPFRLDTAVAYLAANISIPPIAPFITMAELELGSRILTGAWMHVTADAARTLTPGSVARELAVGAAAMSALAATVGGGLTWALAHAIRALRPGERA